MSSNLPEDVRALIDEHLPTMEHVDTLLFAERQRSPFNATQAAGELRGDVQSTERRLHEMVETGLLASDRDAGGRETFRVPARGASQQMAVDSLVNLYQVRPVSLIRYVYERPESARQFADAFRLRKRGD